MPRVPVYRLCLAHLPLTAAFDGPQLTSNGGLCWLSEVDTALGLCATLAQSIPDWRHGAVRHSLETLVRQRHLEGTRQIACGYEDQNDADLASQPTLSRLENAVDAKGCYRLAVALVHLYLEERGQGGTRGNSLRPSSGRGPVAPAKEPWVS